MIDAFNDATPQAERLEVGFANSPSQLGRRAFLKGSTSAGALFAVGGSVIIGSVPSKALAAVVSVELEVKLADIEGTPSRTYNGVVPGPTISAVPGDRIDVRLINNLLPNPDDNDCPTDHEAGGHMTTPGTGAPASHNEPHGENTTNLHTHGLHVSPYKDSTGQFDCDNVFLQVTPKDQVDSCWDDKTFRRHEANYRFELAKDHPPGTNWYHAHKHGSTSLQVSQGMLGPLIIRDPPGHMPAYIENAPERILVFTGKGPWLANRKEGGGDHNPTIILQPGAVERWRIINGNPSATSFLRLAVDSPDVELWQIAYDGLTLPKRVRVKPDAELVGVEVTEPWNNHASVAPGNRTDFMVRVKHAAQNASLALRAVPGSSEFLHDAGDHGLALAVLDVKIPIKIEGDPVDNEWSEDDALPGPGLEPVALVEPAARQSVVFSQVTVGSQSNVNVIDGRPYDGVIDKTMKLGTVEQWTITNETGRTHPFHIHVNPFFVTHIDGRELAVDDPLRRWQDTIALPPKNANHAQASITFLTRFADFTGEFVMHCHILQHEDDGMMQKVAVT